MCTKHTVFPVVHMLLPMSQIIQAEVKFRIQD
jgi:hypothetical protein